MYAQDSIDLLQNSGLQFREHEEHGIEPLEFAELLMSSGVYLLSSVMCAPVSDVFMSLDVKILAISVALDIYNLIGKYLKFANGLSSDSFNFDYYLRRYRQFGDNAKLVLTPQSAFMQDVVR